MTDTKPKALWLAEKLPKYFNANLATSRDIDQVVAELRRLHEVNAELLAALKEAVNLNYRSPSCQIGIINPCKCHDCITNRARAAIAKAEESK